MFEEPNFKRVAINIYKRQNSFSFEERRDIFLKNIHFKPKVSKILIDEIKISGASTEVAQKLKVKLISEIQKFLKKYPFLEISPLNREDLIRKHAEIISLPPSGGKPKIINQYNVDYIVRGDLIID